MKKIVVSPDSFKGSLSAVDAAKIIADAIRLICPDCSVIEAPLSDGGEGAGEIIADALSMHKIHTRVKDAQGKNIQSFYYKNDNTALIESAATIGLTLIPKEKRDIFKASSYGLGMLINEAAKKGYKKIFITLGGSATCDAGIGMLEALGYNFFDIEGNILQGNAKSLSNIFEIDDSDVPKYLSNLEINVISDVTNPLTGDKGAVNVFALQKGAKVEDLPLLEKGMENFVNKASKLKKDALSKSKSSGAGAAGGLGFALSTFLNAKIYKGIDFILDIINYNELIKDADLIITGEGKADRQSLMGKVLTGVLEQARLYEVPVVEIAGKVEDKEILLKAGLSEIYEISNPDLNEEENMEPSIASDNLRKAIERLPFLKI